MTYPTFYLFCSVSIPPFPYELATYSYFFFNYNLRIKNTKRNAPLGVKLIIQCEKLKF